MNSNTILLLTLEIIVLLIAALTLQPAARAEIDILRNEVRAMVAGATGPTEKQLSTLLDRSRFVRDELRRKAGLSKLDV